MRYMLPLLLAACGGDPGVEVTHWDGEDAYENLVWSRVEDAVGEAGSSPNIMWSAEICPYGAPDGQTKTACVFYGQCFNGLEVSDGDYCVALRDPVSESALPHEMLHEARKRLLGDPDLGHEDAQWWKLEWHITTQDV